MKSQNSKRENLTTIIATGLLGLAPALPDYLKVYSILGAVIIVLAFIFSETYLRKVNK
jgi:hypothetical protein